MVTFAVKCKCLQLFRSLPMVCHAVHPLRRKFTCCKIVKQITTTRERTQYLAGVLFLEEMIILQIKRLRDSHLSTIYLYKDLGLIPTACSTVIKEDSYTFMSVSVPQECQSACESGLNIITHLG